MHGLSYERVVDQMISALAETRRARLQRHSAYVALAQAILEDEAAEPERAPGAHCPAHGAEREHVDVRAAELEALREQRLEPDLPRPVVQADDEVAPPARPGAAGEVGREAGIVAPERLRLQARVEQLAWVSKV